MEKKPTNFDFFLQMGPKSLIIIYIKRPYPLISIEVLLKWYSYYWMAKGPIQDENLVKQIINYGQSLMPFGIRFMSLTSNGLRKQYMMSRHPRGEFERGNSLNMSKIEHHFAHSVYVLYEHKTAKLDRLELKTKFILSYFIITKPFCFYTSFYTSL